MKGLALNFVFVIIISVISLAVLLLFFTGPFRGMLTDTFCFFNNNVFKAFGINLGGQLCVGESCNAERVVLEASTKEYLISQLAAYSIMCWTEFPHCGESAICYELVLKEDLDETITELDLTEYLEEQGACHILENSIVYDDKGLQDYPNCGDEDLLQWDVDGYIIKDQKLILIQYDMKNNLIVVKA